MKYLPMALCHEILKLASNGKPKHIEFFEGRRHFMVDCNGEEIQVTRIELRKVIRFMAKNKWLVKTRAMTSRKRFEDVYTSAFA